MKKIILILISTALIISCSSKKENLQSGDSVVSENQIPGKNHEPSNKKNPDYNLNKIDVVLSKMSSRAQKEIKIEDKKDFLKDLEFVLAEEKKYTDEDLPLYYLIDKKHFASSDYVPKNLVTLKRNALYNVNKNGLSLRPDAEKGLQALAQAALNDGIKLLVSSTYRSYAYQDKLFNYWVSVDGLEEAERESARPGTSQHQLGSAIDFGNIDDSFINTKEGKWLNNNAMKYGWSLSFPKNYEDITGYRWECWHYRYIGKPACNLQEKWFKNVQQYMFEFIDLWKSIKL